MPPFHLVPGLLQDVDGPGDHQSQNGEGTSRLYGHRGLGPASERHHIGRAECGGIGKSEIEVVEELGVPARRGNDRVELFGEREVGVFKRSPQARVRPATSRAVTPAASATSTATSTRDKARTAWQQQRHGDHHGQGTEQRPALLSSYPGSHHLDLGNGPARSALRPAGPPVTDTTFRRRRRGRPLSRVGFGDQGAGSVHRRGYFFLIAVGWDADDNPGPVGMPQGLTGTPWRVPAVHSTEATRRSPARPGVPARPRARWQCAVRFPTWDRYQS
jgi:hypothetical protein